MFLFDYLYIKDVLRKFFDKNCVFNVFRFYFKKVLKFIKLIFVEILKFKGI